MLTQLIWLLFVLSILGDRCLGPVGCLIISGTWDSHHMAKLSLLCLPCVVRARCLVPFRYRGLKNSESREQASSSGNIYSSPTSGLMALCLWGRRRGWPILLNVDHLLFQYFTQLSSSLQKISAWFFNVFVFIFVPVAISTNALLERKNHKHPSSGDYVHISARHYALGVQILQQRLHHLVPIMLTCMYADHQIIYLRDSQAISESPWGLPKLLENGHGQIML